MRKLSNVVTTYFSASISNSWRKNGSILKKKMSSVEKQIDPLSGGRVVASAR
jgi:hypothetical protein